MKTTDSATTFDHKTAEALIEGYEELRDRCYIAASRNGGELMGSSAWLRHAFSAHEIQMTATPTGIECTGNTFTSQTQDHEWFDFTIPLDALEA